MKNRIYSIVSAAALSLALTGGAVHAQDLALKQLQDSAVSSMSKLGMDTAMVPELTLEELTQIQSVLAGAGSDGAKTDRIDTILRDADARIAAGGAVTPTGPAGDVTPEDLEGDMVVRANVGAYIAQLGMQDEVDVDMLSTDQVLQVQSIMNSDRDEGAARMAIQQTVLD